MTALWLAFRSQMNLISISCGIEIDKLLLSRIK